MKKKPENWIFCIKLIQNFVEKNIQNLSLFLKKIVFIFSDSSDFAPETPKLSSHPSSLLQTVPAKSSLKRRLTDCMDGEPDHKRFGTEQQQERQQSEEQQQDSQDQQQSNQENGDQTTGADGNGNVEDTTPRKKKNIHFDAVTVYYFPRAQGFTCVPSQVIIMGLKNFFYDRQVDSLLLKWNLKLMYRAFKQNFQKLHTLNFFSNFKVYEFSSF